MRGRTVIATVVSAAAVAAAAAVAVAAGAEFPVAGTVSWCLSPAAAQQLETDGVVVSAGSPAVLDSSGPTPCVQWPMTGQISLDVSSGSWTSQGSVSFTRASDGSSLRLSQAHGDLAQRRMAVEAAVAEEAAETVDLSTYAIDMQDITVTMPSLSSPGSVEAKPFATVLTEEGAAVFTKAFGAPPVPAGESPATVAGRVDVLPAFD
ncbi:hypothetical protein [Streptomyces galilaeus]|uniref:hypothetical protein n=1 Tax=Streptomyces galilaeus TaxID=33899 RepID=UPI00123DD04C|nr:hypothetical protein [Streptomyces galilaeus]GGW87590.1 hypothetical protein GCM10010350_84730 [Streptomyces galilaeus]